MAVAMTLKLTAQAGRRDELLDALRPLAEAAEQEEGTRIYLFVALAGEPDGVLAVEVYDDQAALDAHATGPAMGEALGRLGPLVAGPPETLQGEVAFGKGI